MAKVVSRKTRRTRLIDRILLVYLWVLPAVCLLTTAICVRSISTLASRIEAIETELVELREDVEEAKTQAGSPAETYWVPEGGQEEALPEIETCSVETTVSCTEEEEALLVSLVIAEAKGEPYEGQVAVAQVVCDRVAAGYGATITEVIYAENQFAAPSTESHDKYPLAVEAVHAVLYEGERAFEEPTLFFFNPEWSSPSAVEWLRTKPYVGTIGNHEFRGG